jgi:2',3'-cyclic-nucleotide 2'-phosphodiesterase (5'-nucleotidase family)
VPDPEGLAEPGRDPSAADVAAPRTWLLPMLLPGLVLVAFVIAGALAALLIQSGGLRSFDPVALFLGFIVVVVLWELRRFALVGLREVGRKPLRVAVVGFVMVGAVAAWMFVPSLSIPSSRMVEWHLGDLDPTSAQTTTVIPVLVDRWPVEECYAPADSWLGTPKITYTPWSVIITMRTTDAYDPAKCGSFYTTNWSGKIQLSEPLAGRALLDGSTILPAARPLRSAIASLQILAISDWQGQLDPVSGIGGAAVLSAYFDQERASRPAGTGVLTLTTGNDVGSSTPLSTFFQDTPAILSERMMGVMVGTLGNSNFDAGIGRLQSQIDMAYANASGGASRFHYVTSNLGNRGANLEGVEDYEIFRFGDAKVAFIGVLNEKTPTPLPPGSLGTMSRIDSVAAAMAAKAAAKAEGADVFIAITDMGVSGITGPDPGGELIDFANAVSGFDVIFGGGTDIQYSGTVNDQLVVENRSRGMTYSKTLLTYDRLAAQLTAASNTFVIPTAASVTPDPDVVAMLGTYQGQMSLLLDGTPEVARPAPEPTSSTFSQDKSAACLAATSRVPAYAQRLARDIAALRPLVVAERFDPATTASAIRQVDLTLTAWAEIDPPYHGCATTGELAYGVEYLVATASRMIEMSKAPGITNVNPQQRLVFDLYEYLPEVLAFVYAPTPPPTPAPEP